MKIGDIFYRDIKKGFYPSYTNFVNAIRDKLGSDFLKENRQEIKDYYSSQEIVQVFQPPPLQEALKNKEGFYPKIISFYPFERLYMDTGVIRIFDEPRTKQKEKVEKTADYDENIKKNGEDKFPEDLRWVYPSGIKKTGNKGANKMSSDLKMARARFIIDNSTLFSSTIVKNAQKTIDTETT